MNKLAEVLVIVALLSLLIPLNTLAASGDEYWPNWRGPDNTGAAKSGNPPTTWSETENIKWKVELPGYGLSTPVVWENKIIFLTAIEVDASSIASADTSVILTPAANTRNRGANRGGRSGFGGGGGQQSEYKFDIVGAVPFSGSLATATENQDVNGDGDTDDALTLTVADVEGVLNDFNW